MGGSRVAAAARDGALVAQGRGDAGAGDSGAGVAGARDAGLDDAGLVGGATGSTTLILITPGPRREVPRRSDSPP